EVVARRADLGDRFLFMTGGLVTEADQGVLAAGNGRVLQKPFSREQLLELVGEVLDNSGKVSGGGMAKLVSRYPRVSQRPRTTRGPRSAKKARKRK
ncbi:MAG: hypothetical protein ACE5K9_12610, partial [Candidatus Methylomirabilales bacterium]